MFYTALSFFLLLQLPSTTHASDSIKLPKKLWPHTTYFKGLLSFKKFDSNISELPFPQDNIPTSEKKLWSLESQKLLITLLECYDALRQEYGPKIDTNALAQLPLIELLKGTESSIALVEIMRLSCFIGVPTLIKNALIETFCEKLSENTTPLNAPEIGDFLTNYKIFFTHLKIPLCSFKEPFYDKTTGIIKNFYGPNKPLLLTKKAGATLWGSEYTFDQSNNKRFLAFFAENKNKPGTYELSLKDLVTSTLVYQHLFPQQDKGRWVEVTNKGFVHFTTKDGKDILLDPQGEIIPIISDKDDAVWLFDESTFICKARTNKFKKEEVALLQKFCQTPKIGQIFHHNFNETNKTFSLVPSITLLLPPGTLGSLGNISYAKKKLFCRYHSYEENGTEDDKVVAYDLPPLTTLPTKPIQLYPYAQLPNGEPFVDKAFFICTKNGKHISESASFSILTHNLKHIKTFTLPHLKDTYIYGIKNNSLCYFHCTNGTVLLIHLPGGLPFAQLKSSGWAGLTEDCLVVNGTEHSSFMVDLWHKPENVLTSIALKVLLYRKKNNLPLTLDPQGWAYKALKSAACSSLLTFIENEQTATVSFNKKAMNEGPELTAFFGDIYELFRQYKNDEIDLFAFLERSDELLKTGITYKLFEEKSPSLGKAFETFIQNKNVSPYSLFIEKFSKEDIEFITQHPLTKIITYLDTLLKKNDPYPIGLTNYKNALESFFGHIERKYNTEIIANIASLKLSTDQSFSSSEWKEKRNETLFLLIKTYLTSCLKPIIEAFVARAQNGFNSDAQQEPLLPQKALTDFLAEENIKVTDEPDLIGVPANLIKAAKAKEAICLWFDCWLSKNSIRFDEPAVVNCLTSLTPEQQKYISEGKEAILGGENEPTSFRNSCIKTINEAHQMYVASTFKKIVLILAQKYPPLLLPEDSWLPEGAPQPDLIKIKELEQSFGLEHLIKEQRLSSDITSSLRLLLLIPKEKKKELENFLKKELSRPLKKLEAFVENHDIHHYFSRIIFSEKLRNGELNKKITKNKQFYPYSLLFEQLNKKKIESPQENPLTKLITCFDTLLKKDDPFDTAANNYLNALKLFFESSVDDKPKVKAVGLSIETVASSELASNQFFCSQKWKPLRDKALFLIYKCYLKLCQKERIEAFIKDVQEGFKLNAQESPEILHTHLDALFEDNSFDVQPGVLGNLRKANATIRALSTHFLDWYTRSPLAKNKEVQKCIDSLTLEQKNELYNDIETIFGGEEDPTSFCNQNHKKMIDAYKNYVFTVIKKALQALTTELLPLLPPQSGTKPLLSKIKKLVGGKYGIFTIQIFETGTLEEIIKHMKTTFFKEICVPLEEQEQLDKELEEEFEKSLKK